MTVSLASALMRPELYLLAAGDSVTCIETHISWVFLIGDSVFKLRKPVNLGFVDFQSPASRYEDCLAEIRLNQPLAPDVYRAVVPVWQRSDGELQVGGEPRGPIIDWAVHMRRLDEAERADRLLLAGKLDAKAIERIAARIAEFHATQMRKGVSPQLASPEQVIANVEDNFAATERSLSSYLNASEAAELVSEQRRFLATHRALLERRVALGKVCETHGDLRLEHIYLGADGLIRVLDCVEFSERFRVADVAADLAFLAMDLTRLEHPELADRLLAHYVGLTRDFELYRVIDFYQSYRAFVRAKIAALVARDTNADAETRQRAEAEARRCFRLALAAERPAVAGPALIAVGGGIAAGKTTTAAALADALNAPLIASDPLRKELLSVEPTTPLHSAAFAGAYTEQVTERVYAALLQRAGDVLSSGRSVIVDASFRSREQRARAKQLAQRHGAAFHFIECRASAVVCRQRLEARERAPSVSDGRREIYDAFSQHFEAPTELPPEEHSVLDTSSGAKSDLAPVLGRIPHWQKRC